MKITYDWLKDHLKISAKEDKLLEKLTDIGLEVESIENLSEGLDLFKVAKIIKTEKHPNADRLKVCDVDVGNKEIKKVVCGAANAREGLLTVYAPPGAIIPKNKTKLVVAKIRDVVSYGMLCSESELNLSDESDGITELSSSKYAKNIGKSFFPKSSSDLIDLSITPNRPECLIVRRKAKDLSYAGYGNLKPEKDKKIKKVEKQKNVLVNKKILEKENKEIDDKKDKKIKKSTRKRNIDLQSYKIIFILKDVDPKDPTEELSTILSNSKVNFEIEKIERILDSKNKRMNKN